MSGFAELWIAAGFFFGVGLGFYHGLTEVLKLTASGIYWVWYGRTLK